MNMTKEPSASEVVIASDILKTDVLGRITVGRAQRETILQTHADGDVGVPGEGATGSCAMGMFWGLALELDIRFQVVG
jgi:hypothetical protein